MQKKNGKNICRFYFPLPPMQQTMILKPLEEYESLDNETQKQIKENAEKNIQELNSMKYREDISFHKFLDKLELTEENYLLALRYTLKRTTLFLKRLPSEIRINVHLLKAWRTNMDIQYVLDPYACATYIFILYHKRRKRNEQTS